MAWVLISGDVSEFPLRKGTYLVTCTQDNCTFEGTCNDEQDGRDWLREHSYDKHNPEGKPYPYERRV